LERAGCKPGSVPTLAETKVGAVIYLGCLLPDTSCGSTAEQGKGQPSFLPCS